MPQRVTFPSSDHIQIVGDWVTAPSTLGAIILVHAFSANRKSWAVFQTVLAERGLASIAIDLRGHGESIVARDGSPLAYERFTDDENENSLEDVRAAWDWLRKRGVEPQRIGLAGASIGANLALQFLAEEPQIHGAALLSPGENYHGVTIQDAAARLLPHQAVWMAASRGDDDASVQAVAKLQEWLEVEEKPFQTLMRAGHGTQMLEQNPALMPAIADWLRERLLAA
ncbi:MAG: hypothetical protein RL141_108 [Candidatus Parcubacteria bacterium]|jgi:alpha-beta hydrolase superfamily lysophospholipase